MSISIVSLLSLQGKQGIEDVDAENFALITPFAQTHEACREKITRPSAFG